MNLEERMMKVAKLSVAMLLFALTSCFTAPRPKEVPTIYVMRHLNTPAGATDPDLTPEGQRNAERLANWFGADPPVVIYTSQAKRAQQTAAVLAQRLGITPTLYDPSDTQSMVLDVMKEPGPILIVGHSNTVPEIIERLGGARPGPLVHEDFGDIWRIAGPQRTVTRFRIETPLTR
jgi:broad specificity phosphatase PhoE